MACCFGKKKDPPVERDTIDLNKDADGAPPQFVGGVANGNVHAANGNGHAANEEWLQLAQKSCDDHTGYIEYDGQLLLCNATKKYKKKVMLPKWTPGEGVSFCETKEWYKDEDHWFEVDIANHPDVKEITRESGKRLGKLFTTRMPRGVDNQSWEGRGGLQFMG